MNAEYHNRRLNSSRRELFGIEGNIDIRDLIKIPAGMGMGTYKCRIIYDDKIREIQVLPHQPNIVRSLRIVRDDNIDYAYKYADRSRLEQLLAMKGDCDDILIVQNNCITDASYANIIFQSGTENWVTPDTPLLKGTMRQYLLEKGNIIEQRIGPGDLPGFERAMLINCMMDLENGFLIDIRDIKA
jgi:4-amino-4-deoxychorismate lyase